jgi:hypothetical protein
MSAAEARTSGCNVGKQCNNGSNSFAEKVLQMGGGTRCIACKRYTAWRAQRQSVGGGSTVVIWNWNSVVARREIGAVVIYRNCVGLIMKFEKRPPPLTECVCVCVKHILLCA